MRRVSVEGRTKSIHSTWRKMRRRSCRVEEVHDLLALRIVIEPEASVVGPSEEASLCYHILGKVPSAWTPMPRLDEFPLCS